HDLHRPGRVGEPAGRLRRPAGLPGPLLGDRRRVAGGADMSMTGTRPSRAARGAVPPGPPPWAAPVLYHRLVTDRLGLLSRAAARYGDAVRLTIGPKTIYLFNHPDHAKH